MNRRCILALMLSLFLLSGCNESNVETTTQPQIATETASHATTENSVDTIPTESTYNSDVVVEEWTDSTSLTENLENDKATEPATHPTTPTVDFSVDSSSCTYEDFMKMTGEQQQAFFESFDSLEDFKLWHKQALKIYNQSKPPEVTGDGNIDITDYLPNQS